MGTAVRRLVVMGTGTEVGKTWVTRGLAAMLRADGARVCALKPIESGISLVAPGGDKESDGELLASASTDRPRVAPYRFMPPISPHLAARRTGRQIELATVVDYVRTHENDVTSDVTSFVLVETAGGCFTPLGAGITNLDLALALEPSTWLLVAPDALGVLHDVGATLEALRRRGRSPDHLVLSASRPADASTGTNAGELEALGIAVPSAVLARDDTSSLRPLARSLCASSLAPRAGAGAR